MQKLFEVRKKHGSIFVTIFSDDIVIPWKPLTVEEYIKYQLDQSRRLISIAQLEDEIFRKCVQDESLIRQMPFLKAGIISTVVSNIWQQSGPSGIDSFNKDLDTARYLLQLDGIKILHQLVQIVSTAFPYKPEEIYAMDYETLLFRTVQAEEKLIQLGHMKEPLQLEVIKQEEKETTKDPSTEKKPIVDAKKLWELQQKDKQPKGKITPRSSKKWWKKSPVIEAQKTHNIDFNIEKKELDIFGVSSHDKTDLHINRAKMIEDAKVIYKDLLEELSKKPKK